MKTHRQEILKLVSAFEKTCQECAKTHEKKDNVLSDQDVAFFNMKLARFTASMASYTYDELGNELQDFAFAVKFIGTQTK